jgi:hypothetical protein
MGGLRASLRLTARSVSAKRRRSADDSHRAFTAYAVSTWGSEELDERPHALFLTAAAFKPRSMDFVPQAAHLFRTPSGKTMTSVTTKSLAAKQKPFDDD